jgi:hypothetical protein
MVARVWCFQPALGLGLYRGEVTMWHMNSRTESISNLGLESLISFRFLERDRIGLVWLRFHSKSVETGLAVAPRWVQGSTQLRVGWRISAQHGWLGLGAATVAALG